MYAGGEHRVCGRRRGAAGHLAGAAEDALVAVHARVYREYILVAFFELVHEECDLVFRILLKLLNTRLKSGRQVVVLANHVILLAIVERDNVVSEFPAKLLSGIVLKSRDLDAICAHLQTM